MGLYPPFLEPYLWNVIEDALRVIISKFVLNCILVLEQNGLCGNQIKSDPRSNNSFHLGIIWPNWELFNLIGDYPIK